MEISKMRLLQDREDKNDYWVLFTDIDVIKCHEQLGLCCEIRCDGYTKTPSSVSPIGALHVLEPEHFSPINLVLFSLFSHPTLTSPYFKSLIAVKVIQISLWP
jgi:hypothetical protein